MVKQLVYSFESLLLEGRKLVFGDQSLIVLLDHSFVTKSEVTQDMI